MKKMDEMEQNIVLRSMAWGCRTAAVLLSVWVLYQCWQTLVHDAPYFPISGFILCCSVCVQGFYQLALRQKMVSGDDEYRETNRFVRTVLVTVILTAALLAVSVWLLLMGNAA